MCNKTPTDEYIPAIKMSKRMIVSFALIGAFFLLLILMR